MTFSRVQTHSYINYFIFHYNFSVYVVETNCTVCFWVQSKPV